MTTNEAKRGEDAASDAIAESKDGDRIETITLRGRAYDAARAVLLAECDDHVEANGQHEFWGSHADHGSARVFGSGEWRVHLALEQTTRDSVTNDQIRELCREAEQHGDADLARHCEIALGGGFGLAGEPVSDDAIEDAIEICVNAIRASEAAWT